MIIIKWWTKKKGKENIYLPKNSLEKKKKIHGKFLKGKTKPIYAFEINQMWGNEGKSINLSIY